MVQDERPSLDDIDRLIAVLSEGSSDDAQDAQALLTELGRPAAERLLQQLTDLSTFGKLCAIEVISAAPPVAAGTAFAGLLGDENSTVREWAATALGELRHRPAVEELLQLHNRLLTEAVPVDWSEPVAVRAALTVLGAHQAVQPPMLEQLATVVLTGMVVWPAENLEGLIEALAEGGQTLLYFMTWRRGGGERLFWQQHDSAGWAFDPAAPWNENVRLARDAALLEASTLSEDRSNLVVSLEWIGAEDVEPNAGALRRRPT